MSQGNITASPMASSGGLKDLILRCLVFGAVPSICFTRMRVFYLEVSDSEELVGVITGDEGVCIRVYS